MQQRKNNFHFAQVQDNRTIIGKALFKKETRIEMFVSMKVELSTGIACLSLCVCNDNMLTGERGVIDGAFGTSGKFRVTIPGELC